MADKTADGCGGGARKRDLFIRLPNCIINEILEKQDLESLCSAACVCRILHFSVSQVLSSFSTLDLSSFSPDVQTLNHILYRLSGGLKSITLDCLHLDDSAVSSFLGDNIQELSLLKCSLLSYQVLATIGKRCPNLRVLALELAGQKSPDIFNRNFIDMITACSHLESLSIKIRGTEFDANCFFHTMELFLPRSIKVLKLQTVLVQEAIHIIQELEDGRKLLETSTKHTVPLYPGSPCIQLQCLSLVLDVISDELILSIVNSLPLLVELDLEDRPRSEPLLPHDLTNTGLQSLSSCQHLTVLALVRGRQNHLVSFKTVNDMGMFLLSEGCRGLQSVRFAGFSKVSDAGFAAILHSCQNLKKLEVRNASLLSDLAFHDITNAPCSLVEVRILSCGLITSESADKLSASSRLEVLDLSGCRSVADACLGSISCLHNLSMLNLGAADLTDSGLALIGRGCSPITRLCLRGCKRITDKGITHLLHGGGAISKTLSALDIGYLPGISDKAVFTIAAAALNITELCIRYCFSVTDASLRVLASKGNGNKLLRRVDLFHCLGLSSESLRLLKKPSFRGLQWVGVGRTRLISKGYNVFTEILKERPWLTLCLDGCEIGCHDGWQFHKFDGS